MLEKNKKSFSIDDGITIVVLFLFLLGLVCFVYLYFTLPSVSNGVVSLKPVEQNIFLVGLFSFLICSIFYLILVLRGRKDSNEEKEYLNSLDSVRKQEEK